MTRWRARAAALVLAAISMAHVGSPDTFFGGKAGFPVSFPAGRR